MAGTKRIRESKKKKVDTARENAEEEEENQKWLIVPNSQCPAVRDYIYSFPTAIGADGTPMLTTQFIFASNAQQIKKPTYVRIEPFGHHWFYARPIDDITGLNHINRNVDELLELQQIDLTPEQMEMTELMSRQDLWDLDRDYWRKEFHLPGDSLRTLRWFFFSELGVASVDNAFNIVGKLVQMLAAAKGLRPSIASLRGILGQSFVFTGSSIACYLVKLSGKWRFQLKHSPDIFQSTTESASAMGHRSHEPQNQQVRNARWVPIHEISTVCPGGVSTQLSCREENDAVMETLRQSCEESIQRGEHASVLDSSQPGLRGTFGPPWRHVQNLGSNTSTFCSISQDRGPLSMSDENRSGPADTPSLEHESSGIVIGMNAEAKNRSDILTADHAFQYDIEVALDRLVHSPFRFRPSPLDLLHAALNGIVKIGVTGNIQGPPLPLLWHAGPEGDIIYLVVAATSPYQLSCLDNLVKAPKFTLNAWMSAPGLINFTHVYRGRLELDLVLELYEDESGHDYVQDCVRVFRVDFVGEVAENPTPPTSGSSATVPVQHEDKTATGCSTTTESTSIHQGCSEVGRDNRQQSDSYRHMQRPADQASVPSTYNCTSPSSEQFSPASPGRVEVPEEDVDETRGFQAQPSRSVSNSSASKALFPTPERSLSPSEGIRVMDGAAESVIKSNVQENYSATSDQQHVAEKRSVEDTLDEQSRTTPEDADKVFSVTEAFARRALDSLKANAVSWHELVTNSIMQMDANVRDELIENRIQLTFIKAGPDASNGSCRVPTLAGTENVLQALNTPFGAARIEADFLLSKSKRVDAARQVTQSRRGDISKKSEPVACEPASNSFGLVGETSGDVTRSASMDDRHASKSQKPMSAPGMKVGGVRIKGKRRR